MADGYMNSKRRATFLEENELTILEAWCPDPCQGQLVDHPTYLDPRPILCLDCGRRMNRNEPVAWPGTTIGAKDWANVTWLVDEERRVALAADLVDEILERVRSWL